MEAGFSSKQIPINDGYLLSGYLQRTEKSNGILDDLYVRTCVIKAGKKKTAFISVDTLAITRKTTAFFERKIKEKGIEIEKIIFSATHTHSAPAISNYDDLMIADSGYSKVVLDKIAESLTSAVKNLKKCVVSFESDIYDIVGKSRISKGKKSYVYLNGLYFWHISDDGRSRELAGGLLNYNCHPTVLSAENLKISSEFSGATVRSLEKKYGGSGFLFVNGAAGDISTRFTRNSQSYRQVLDFGEELSGRAEKQIKNLENLGKFEDITSLTMITKNFSMEGKKTRNYEIIESEIDQIKKKMLSTGGGDKRILETMLQGLKIEKNRTSQRDLEYEAEVNIIKLGEVCIVTVPGEFYSYYQEKISEKRSKLIFIGYANGYTGYIPENDNENPESYEEASAHLYAENGKRILEFILSSLDYLYQKK